MNEEAELRQNIATGQQDRYARLQVAMLARGLGFDPKEFAKPFPGNHINVTHNHAKPVFQGGNLRPILGTLLGLGLGAAGVAIGGPLLGGLFSSTSEKVIEKIITKPGSHYDVDVDMEVIPPPH